MRRVHFDHTACYRDRLQLLECPDVGLLDRPVSDLWTMRHGYAMCSESGLAAIARLLAEIIWTAVIRTGTGPNGSTRAHSCPLRSTPHTSPTRPVAISSRTRTPRWLSRTSAR